MEMNVIGRLAPGSGLSFEGAESLVGVLEEKWTMQIIWAIITGSHRFIDIETQVGAQPSVVIIRLRKLEDAGLIRTEPYQNAGSRTRHAYWLTPHGAELEPILTSLIRWATN